MKKVMIVLTGCLLFLAGYQQTRRQTEYMTTKMSVDDRALPAKPMVIPQSRPLPLFAFRLKQAIFD